MTKLYELRKGNPRQFFLTVGVCCAYGLLLGGLIVLNAQKPSAKDEAAAFDTAVIDFPASNAKDANKAALANTAFPIQELHRKAKNLPVENFGDLD